MIGDGLADGIFVRRNGLSAVDVDVPGSALSLVRGVNRRGCRIGAAAGDGADVGAGRVVGGDDTGG